MKKRLLAWVLTLAMLVSVMPIGAFAEGGEEDAVHFTKELIPATSTQPAKIKLEAYTTGSVSISTTSKPTDVVLVLDQSGSMEGTYLRSMKTAVEGFVDEVMDLNGENRIAIVGFASESDYGNNTEVLTLQGEEKEEIITYTYEAVNVNEMDTDEHYYISYGQDYRQIRYFARTNWYDAGWYTLGYNGQRNDYVDVSNRTVYKRVANTEEVTEYYTGVPYENLLNLLETGAVDLEDALTSDDDALQAAIDALDAEGATRTDLGMELAEMILAESNRENKIVVLLTDGVPTSWSEFDTAVANDAVEAALSMKKDGVHIFSMYLGNPSSASTNFLQAVSSNYPEAMSISDRGDKAADSYYAAHSSSLGIEEMLTAIVNTINANSQLNESAVVTDELTPWFELPDGSDPDQIAVYTVDKTASGWSEDEVLFENANIEIVGGDKIEVTGFNFAYHCVTEEPKQSGGSDYGRKLVIYIPIVENDDEDTFGGWLPTNEQATISQGDYEKSALGCFYDVSIQYSLKATARAYHIGSTETYTVKYHAEYLNDILDEMITMLPDGSQNEGVDMVYALYDAGEIGIDGIPTQSSQDDILIARLEVNAGKEIDPTDFANWAQPEGAPLEGNITPGEDHFGEKVYVLVCTLTSAKDEDELEEGETLDSLTVYALLDIAVTNEDAYHIVYGEIDAGGTLDIIPKAGNTEDSGDLFGNTYTEAVKESESSDTMVFTPKKGYEIETITKRVLEDGALKETIILYNVDDGHNAEYDPEENVTYTFQATNVQGGIEILVETRQIQFELTTEHDSNSSIMPGQTYGYDEQNKLDVWFEAHRGYQLTSLAYGETEDDAITYDLTTTDGLNAAQEDPNVELILEKGVVIEGDVSVPKTRDNYVAVETAERNYKLTYIYYWDTNNDGVYEVYLEKEPKTVAYGADIYNNDVYLPGDTEKMAGATYTLSEWYRTATGTVFDDPIDIERTKMPASDLTLHAFWEKAPNILIDEIKVEKKVIGSYSKDQTFTFQAKMGQTDVGQVEIEIPADSTEPVSVVIPIMLTDAQHTMLVNGTGVISIQEVEVEDNIWNYDSAVYRLSWSNGGYVLTKVGSATSETDLIASFTNQRVNYTVTYTDGVNEEVFEDQVHKDLAYGADTPAFDADQETDGIQAGKPTRTGYTFIGWSPEVTNTVEKTVTYVAQWRENSFEVTYKYIGEVPANAPAVPEKATYKDGDPVTVADAPTLRGYTFDGWSKTGTFTMPAENVEITGSWIKNESETQPTKYTVKYTIEGAEQENDTIEVTGTAWILDAPAMIAIAEGGIPTPANKYTGYKLDPSNPAYPDAGTSVESGSIYVVNYVKDSGTTKDLTYNVVYCVRNAAGTEIVETLANEQKTVQIWVNDSTYQVTSVADKTFVGYKKLSMPELPITVSNGDTLYVYYAKELTPIVPGDTVSYIVEHYKANADGTYPAAPTDKEILGGKIGDTVTATPKTYDGYCVNLQAEGTVQNGTLVKIEDADDIVVLKLYYDADIVGEEEGGDEIPDKYQKKVTFVVVNGSWNDKTDADKVVYIALEKNGKWDAAGTGALTAPAVGNEPNEGFKAGSWDVTPPTTVSGLDAVTYTYTYAKSTTPIVPGDTVSYIVEHYKADADGTYPATPTEKEILGGKIGATVTATPKTYDGYCVNLQAEGTVQNGTLVKIEGAADIVVLKLYYDADELGNDGPDNIPDKYQKKVTFVVVNGNWNDKTDMPKTVYVTLEKDGKWDVNGTGVLTAPAVGNEPDDGFKAGSWDVTPPATVSGLDAVTYTYTYARSTTPIVPSDTVSYIVEHYKADTDGTYPATPTDTEILGGKIGATVTAIPKTYDGYCVNLQAEGTVQNGKLVKIEDADDIVVLKLYYDADVVGGEDGEDDIPDKYQKKITFVVVNGDWNDKTDADKIVYVTLEKDGKWDAAGTGALTAPSVGTEPDEGFKAGSWDVTPPTTVNGLDAVTYTYTYARSTTPIVPGDTVSYIVEHYKANADGTYPVTPTDTEILGSKIGATVTATPKTYDGYCVNLQAEGTVQSGKLVKIEGAADIVVLKLYYDTDVIGGEDGGDDTPDKYQIIVNYVSDNEDMGTVSRASEIITLVDENGKWVESGNAKLSGSTATAKDGYAFTKWMYQSITFAGSETLEFTLGNAKGGNTYTFTAYWTPKASPVVPAYAVYKVEHYKQKSVDGDYELVSADTEFPLYGEIGETVTATAKNYGKNYAVNHSLSIMSGAVIEVTTDETSGEPVYLVLKVYYDMLAPADLKVEKVVHSIVDQDGNAKTLIYDENGKLTTMAAVGDKITWAAVVSNLGETPITISITDTLIINGVVQEAADVKVWGNTSITLGGGATDTYLYPIYSYTVKEGDKEIVNSITVSGTEDDEPKGSDEAPGVTVEQPDLAVTKTASKTSVEVGDKITYTITVTNTGNVELTNVVVSDDFTKGGDEDRTWTIDKLAVGESKVISFEYKTVNADRNGLKNTAIADSDETEPKTTPEVDVDVEREPITPVGPSKPELNKKDHYAYIVGYPDGLVHPERNITRAEVSTIFFRMLLDESRDYFWAQSNNFTDVPADKWFNNAVSTLANAELINGYPDGSFRPNANITRAEFATIAIRFFLDEDVEITENNLSDVKDHWAEANIDLAYALGLINGYPDGTFRPNQLITRAEAMTIVNRVLNRAPHKDHLLEDMIQWPDNMNEDVWYYAAVQEATNSHEFYLTKNKGEDDEYEIWTELLPVRDWVALEQEWSDANSSKNPGEVVSSKTLTTLD